MTNYFATNNAKDWNQARNKQTAAKDDGTIGNLSFRRNTSQNKKHSSSSREVVERYGLTSTRSATTL